jgi:hypothetical protein
MPSTATNLHPPAAPQQQHVGTRKGLTMITAASLLVLAIAWWCTLDRPRAMPAPEHIRAELEQRCTKHSRPADEGLARPDDALR